jgi:hypothetical protein
MKKASELDKQCEKIFNVLAVNPNPITFNKLFEKLEQEMTKPTLIKHLNHLQKQKIAKREKIGKQKVTYQLHEDCFNELENEREFLDQMNEAKNEIEIFNGLSLRDKVQYLLLLTTLAQIDQLKFTLQMLSEPKEEFKFKIKTAFTKYALSAKIQYLLQFNPEIDLKEAIKQIEEIEKYFWKKAALKRDITDIF